MYWVGQIVCSGFSVRCYGQSWTFWPTQSLIRWCLSAWEEKQMSAWYRLRIAVFLWLGAHPGLHLRLYSVQFSSVRSLSCVQLFVTPWIAARQASLSITNSRNLLKLMPIELVIPSSHLILCRPLLLLPPIPPSITVFSNESTLRMT